MADSVDRARFEALALPHLGAAYTLASHLMRNAPDAEDAVQDAYMRAYRALHQLEGADIKPWLLTIVRNVSLTYEPGGLSQPQALAHFFPE